MIPKSVDGAGAPASFDPAAEAQRRREEELRRLEEELRRIQREMEEARRRAEQARGEQELQAARTTEQQLQKRLQQLSQDVARFSGQGNGASGHERARIHDLRDDLAFTQASLRSSLQTVDRVTVAAPSGRPARFWKDDLAFPAPAPTNGPTFRVDPSGTLVPDVAHPTGSARGDRWELEEASPPSDLQPAAQPPESASAQAAALYEALNKQIRGGGRGGGAIPVPDVAGAEQILRGASTDADNTALLQAFQEKYDTSVASFILSRLPAGEGRVNLLALAQTSPDVTAGMVAGAEMPMPDEQAIALAGRLNQAMYKSLGTDEQGIFDALRGLSAAEAQQVAYQYEVHYNPNFDPKTTPFASFPLESSLLYSRLQGELQENTHDWARAQALLRGDPAAAAAIALAVATEKAPLFRSGDEMLNVLRNAEPAERLAIINAFAQDYAQSTHAAGGGMAGAVYLQGKDMPQYDPDPSVLLTNVLRDELGANELAEAQGLIAAAKQNENAAVVASSQGAAVESRLTSLLDRWIPDGAGALDVLKNLTPEERGYLQSLAPAGGASSPLQELMRSKLSASDFQQATAYLHGDAASAQAEALHEALTRVAHGRGGALPMPDTAGAEQLLRGLKTDAERQAFLSAFQEKYGTDPSSLISGLPAGANRDILMALVQSSPETLTAPGIASDLSPAELEFRADALRRASQRLLGVDEAAVRQAFAGLTAEQAGALASQPLDPSNPGGPTLKDELAQWYRAGSGRFGLEVEQMLDGDAAARGDVREQIDEAQAQYVFETSGPGAAINEALQGLFGSQARAVLDMDAARLQAAETALGAAPVGAQAQASSEVELAYMQVGQTDYENAKDLTAEVAKTTATAAAVVVTTAATAGTAAAAWAPILAGATASVGATQLRGNANSWSDNIVAGLEGGASGIVLPGTAVATEGGQFVVREVVTVGGREVLRDVPVTLAREVAESALTQGGKELLDVGGRRFTVTAFEHTLGQTLQQNVKEAVVGSVVGDVTAGTVRGDLRGEQVLQNAALSALTAGAVTIAAEGVQTVLHSPRGQGPELDSGPPEASPTEIVLGSSPGNEVPPPMGLEAHDAGRSVAAAAAEPTGEPLPRETNAHPEIDDTQLSAGSTSPLGPEASAPPVPEVSPTSWRRQTELFELHEGEGIRVPEGVKKACYDYAAEAALDPAFAGKTRVILNFPRVPHAVLGVLDETTGRIVVIDRDPLSRSFLGRLFGTEIPLDEYVQKLQTRGLDGSFETWDDAIVEGFLQKHARPEVPVTRPVGDAPVPPVESGINPAMQDSLVQAMKETGVAEIGVRGSDPEGQLWHGVGGGTVRDAAGNVRNPGPRGDFEPELVDGRLVFPTSPIPSTGALYPTKPEGAISLDLDNLDVVRSLNAARAERGLPPLHEAYPDLPIPREVPTEEGGTEWVQQLMFGEAKPVIANPVYDANGRVVDGYVLMTVPDVDIAYARWPDGRRLTNEEVDQVVRPAINRIHSQNNFPGQQYDLVNHPDHFSGIQIPDKLRTYDLDAEKYWNSPVYKFRADAQGYTESAPLGSTYRELVDPDFVPRWQQGVAPLPARARPIEILPDKVRYALELDPGKAAGFRMLGFGMENPESFVELIAGTEKLIVEEAPSAITAHGTKYRVTMEIAGPDGPVGRVDVVWQRDHGSQTFRFITAMPRPYR